MRKSHNLRVCIENKPIHCFHVGLRFVFKISFIQLIDMDSGDKFIIAKNEALETNSVRIQ